MDTSRRHWPNRQGCLAVAGLAVCLVSCSTTPRPGLSGSVLSPEAERRADAAAHYGAGVLYQYQGKTDEALAEFEKAVELDPANEELAVTVASEFFRREENQRAILLLERAVERNPNSVRLLSMLGYAYRINNDLDKSLRIFRTVIKLAPTNISAYQNLVALHIFQGKRQEALKLLTQAYRQKSDDPKYWSGLGDLYATTVYEQPKSEEKESVSEKPSEQKGSSRTVFAGKVNPFVGFARALDCYEKAASLDPQDERILSRLADLYVVNKVYDKAVQTYLRILELRPNSVNIREKLALSYVAQDDKIKAIEQIEEIVKKEPLKFKYYMMLGELYLDASRGEKEEKPKQGEETAKEKLLGLALDKFQQAVVLNPNEIDPQLNIAYIYLLLKKPDQSLATLDRAKEKFSTNPKLFYFYGLTHSDLKQYEQAMRAFADAETLAKESETEMLDSAFYFYYGAACERAGHIESAAEHFRQSIDLNPHNAEAYNYLGYMWAEKGIRLTEALDYIKKALELEPDNGAYVDSLGWVYFKLGRYDEALQYLLRAAALLTEPDPVVYDHIAEAYMQLGNKKDALEHWKKAVELDPENKEIAEKLKRLETAK